MRWLKDIEEVGTVLKEANKCAPPDDNTPQPGLERLTFDSVEFHSRRFLNFLHQLMEWSGDRTFRYAVLNPDPVKYFFSHFQKYPMLEISLDDPEEAYLGALTEDPGGSPADAVGTNWSEYVIQPPSKKWCIHGRRDARSGEGGHLWVPKQWTDRAKAAYPYALH